MRKMLYIFAVVMFLSTGITAHTQTTTNDVLSENKQSIVESQVMQVSTIVREPFVVQDGERLTGFSIELWDIISKRNQWEYEYVVYERFVDFLSSVREPATADAAIANISITSDRAQVMDFSSSIFNGGLQIIIPDTTARRHIFAAFSNTAVYLYLLMIALLFILLGRVLYQHNEAKVQHTVIKTYISLATLGLVYSKYVNSSYTRKITLIWLVCFTLSVIGLTYEITHSAHIAKSGSRIESYQDLRGSIVGVTAGSTAENYMRVNNISSVSFDSIDRMFEQVAKGQIDAVVHDAPVLQHFATYRGSGRVILIGDIFNAESYGVALPKESGLTKQVNRTLLEMKEDGTYQYLLERWFDK